MATIDPSLLVKMEAARKDDAFLVFVTTCEPTTSDQAYLLGHLGVRYATGGQTIFTGRMTPNQIRQAGALDWVKGILDGAAKLKTSAARRGLA